MKFSGFVPALLIGSAAASSLLQPRATNNYKGVVADIKAIKAQLKTTESDVNAYSSGDFVGPIKILTDSTTLENDINTATNDTTNSAAFGNKGSNAVAAAVLSLQKPINSTLDALIAKKPEFDAGIFGFPLTPIVLSTLKTLKSDTDKLGAAIVPKLIKADRGLAPSIIKSIDAQFDKAIAVFSSSS